MTENAFFTSLPPRGLIHIEGEDRHDFLQGLITNDIKKLRPGGLLYACLLTPQGKFLHDFFIAEGDDFLLLDCEGGTRAQDLYKRLNTYRLRAKVKISVEESIPVYAIFSPTPLTSPLPQEGGGKWGVGVVFLDPRHAQLGFRTHQKLNLPEKPFSAWDERRIRLGIPDGSRDLTPEQSTMDEAHMDRLNAVDYDKGCYVGQELTARMHYRGLGKKHLYAVEGATLPEPGADIIVNGKSIGEMRSRCGNVGLALLKDSELEDLKNSTIKLIK